MVRIRGSGSVPKFHRSTTLGSVGTVRNLCVLIPHLRLVCSAILLPKASLFWQLAPLQYYCPFKIHRLKERRGREAWGRLETIFLHSFPSPFLTKRGVPEGKLESNYFFSAANSTNFLSLEKKNYPTRETVFFLYTYLRLTYLWPVLILFFSNKGVHSRASICITKSKVGKCHHILLLFH